LPVGRAGARRYADAIFELARESGEYERWDYDLGLMGQVFRDRGVQRFFEDPKRQPAEKHDAIRKMFGGRVRPEALNLLLILTDRDRTGDLPVIQERYEERARQEHGIVVAEVTTAIPVDAAERVRIQAELERTTGKRVQMHTNVDPEIIGGLVVRIGDKLMDGSVRTSLLQLRERLAR
jgi:F-type H+-transporting ATPase subunit delta